LELVPQIAEGALRHVRQRAPPQELPNARRGAQRPTAQLPPARRQPRRAPRDASGRVVDEGHRHGARGDPLQGRRHGAPAPPSRVVLAQAHQHVVQRNAHRTRLVAGAAQARG
ncbi:MAG: hypothetical protein ACK56I_29780, partial [bacterium]